MTLAVLSPQDAVFGCAVLILVYGLARLKGRMTLGFGKATLTLEDVREMKDTVQRVEAHTKSASEVTAEIKKAVGDTDGGGDMATMLADLSRKVDLLDERTQVTRFGEEVPEDVGTYAQKWFHKLNGRLTTLIGHIWLVQQALREQGINVPDMPRPADLDLADQPDLHPTEEK